jgi:hypothetical protein
VGEDWDACPVFERLTKQARQVVARAQVEARELKHDYVGSEHLLLGLLAVPDGEAIRQLASLGITLELVRDRIVRTVGRGEQDSPDAIPFTPRSKKLLTVALEQALSLGDDYIATEHILLAVVSENEAVAAGVLRNLGVDLDHARRTVIQTRAAAQGRPPIEEVPPAGPEAGGSAATDEDGPRATSSQVHSETYGSARELARAFSAPVLEPTWWPADTQEISYDLARSGAGGRHYQIGSIRSEGVPICVVGHLEAALAGRSPRDWLHGEWSEPPELKKVRGLIGQVGIPRQLQAVIYDHQLQIQLIGYDSHEEIINAVSSLRQASLR